MNDKNHIPIHPCQVETERIDQLVQRLHQQYGVNPADVRIVRAPLRISPLGAHIDHQLGHVTGLTIDRTLLLAFAPGSDQSVKIESLNFSPALSFPLNQVPAYIPHDWGNYIRGAVLALQQAHTLRYGLVGVISGEMPVGGLSSSAAVTLTYLHALAAVNALDIPREDFIGLVRYAENKYIGVNNGILDQTSILFSQPNQLTYIDCKTSEVKHIPATINPDAYDILIVFSGVSRILSGTGYNNRVAECQQAAKQLLEFAGQAAPENPKLGDVDPAIFDAEGHRLPPLLRMRAQHYFGEFRRVTAGIAAWQANNLGQFGALMNQSGESSIKLYESGSPQLTSLYQILSQTPGVYGSRFSGAGFGGSCLAIIDPHHRESIAEAVHRQYPPAHPKEAENYSLHFCRSAGSVQVI